MSAERAVWVGLLGLFLVGGGLGCEQLQEMIERKEPIGKDSKADDEETDDEETSDEETDDEENEDDSKKKKAKKDKKDAKKDKKSSKKDAKKDEDDDDDAVRPLDTRLADLSGTYEITNSSNPGGGGAYRGSVSLSRDGDTYSVGWTIANTPPFKGVAIPAGSILGVGWGMGADYGVAVYKIKRGELDGRWATGTSGAKLGRDTLRLTSKPASPNTADIEGTYDMEGTTPSGEAFSGKAVITRSSDVFHVKFTGDDGRGTISGVGIRDGDILTFGWGTQGRQAGVVTYRADGKELIGRWAAPGGSQLGTEDLRRSP